MQRGPRTPSLLTIIIIIPFCCYTRLDTVSPSDNDHDDNNNNNDTHQPLGTSRRRLSRSLDTRHSRHSALSLARSLSLYLAIYLWISIDTVLYYDNLSGATHITDS